MKIHEYQAKEILRKFGVAVPRGYLAVTPLEAEGAARQLGGGICAVKAQIHAGGRGKGGGVRLARSPDEARQHAEAMLGMMLKTPQTGPEGQEVRKVYIEEGCRIARELYLGMTLDREARPARGHGVDRGRRRHRGGRGEAPGEDPPRVDRPAHRAHAVPGAAARVRARPHRRLGDRVRALRDRPLQRLRRDRRVARRDQPARHHRRAARCSRSTRR